MTVNTKTLPVTRYSAQEALNILLTSGFDMNAPFNALPNSHSAGLDISSAQTLTPPNNEATKLLIQAMTQNVRYTLDGTVPTANVGFRITAGNEPFIIPIGPNTIIKVIQESATANLQMVWGY